MALSANALVTELPDQQLREWPVYTAVHIYKGALLGLTATGYVVPWDYDYSTIVGGLLFLGIAYEEKDNTSGASGALNVRAYTKGDFVLAISGVAIADVGRVVYATDDGTLTLTANTHPIGKVVNYESSGNAVVRLTSHVGEYAVLGRSITAVGEVDCQTGATPQTLVLIPAHLNETGMVIKDAWGVISEAFAGAGQDQGIVEIEDTDATDTDLTFTPSDAGADALNDLVIVTEGGTPQIMRGGSTGDPIATIAAGKGLQITVNQVTSGAGAAGKLKVIVEAVLL